MKFLTPAPVIKFTHIVAAQTLECWRCNDSGRIGLIFKGDPCTEIRKDDKIAFACEECYERLCFEVEDEL